MQNILIGFLLAATVVNFLIARYAVSLAYKTMAAANNILMSFNKTSDAMNKSLEILNQMNATVRQDVTRDVMSALKLDSN